MPSTASQRGSSRLSTTSSHSLPSSAADDAASSPPPPPPPPPSRPGLLSRLSLPLTLRNRNRNVADFHVRPNEPYRQYAAGDHVRGTVVLAIVKPVRITHLVVSLNGFVRAFKDPVSAGKLTGSAVPLPHGSSSRPQYHGNGFASLFQDEQVLSGEGRLEPARYEFGFDLVFPDKGLPSSIDFERGTISYTITATLTRPTSIAPTASCDRKVMLVEKIDIGLLPPPRPRTIFLEPISRRTRRKRSMATDKSSTVTPDINEAASEAESADQSAIVDDTTRETPGEQQRSPMQYDMRSESGGSARSVSTAISRTELAQLSQVGTTFASPAQQQVVDNKTITTTIELLRGGCLPGDTVSVRVTVQHIKRVKSMTGVVVTLFRQCKIDTSPPLSAYGGLLSREEAKSMQREETFPRVRAGLAGLSLSSSGSTNTFRKDLDQNTAPLITDPETLQASVTVSLKLPDDSFPTISGVPGDMLSFKYQVEVIVDLGGRLSNLIQGGSSTSRFGAYSTSTPESGNSMFGPRRGTAVADTALLRREKGVVSVSLETVVGTADSSRNKKRRMSPGKTFHTVESDEDEVIRPETVNLDEMLYSPAYLNGEPPQANFPPHANDPRYYSLPPPPLPTENVSPTPSGSSRTAQGAAPTYVPPPQLPDQTNLSEKERIRQAETRLLPSQPPDGPSSSSVVPEAPEDDDLYDAQSPQETPTAPALGNPDAGPSAPTEDELTVAPPGEGEDKQERERLRLMNEASAPPEVPPDVGERSSAPARSVDAEEAEPTAPVLDEDGDDDPYAGYGVGAGPSRRDEHRHGEALPAYER
ncbi:hypothetical protein S7711_00948 [Stachybotrys chartarum IBT 7711]|uniref:Arrestin C-terminal-like domain-containing protein n=1 Tax=Stachybotrys chartarum (strain CBS 109288 / IBT 7711) TaxID=1280523 RepID=A0A084B0P7_STACB|nr:hypothetical protein S7711_00948 [Stachybotrys chartarum IBT 7711]KFA51033.1 hypothetical protein S40293_07920 [Stachybotrys chartarum IBT 40293]